MTQHLNNHFSPQRITALKAITSVLVANFTVSDRPRDIRLDKDTILDAMGNSLEADMVKKIY